ncbi:uncharacterized protein LOC115892399 isoform X1 [Rhinopithecus roxellana]|uniref:uncharacterized protein LOC115892399 isoform X1 n=1 Tax=Rhinopithecus roxellana TaxID=61622 RepID=UPI00123788C9|nr:uncharacterized protein LOC115892399 isoform X1 [Rhinopithecus roxellana]
MGTGAVGPRRRDGAGGTLARSPPGTASLQDVHGTRPCAHRLLLSFQLSSGRPSPPGFFTLLLPSQRPALPPAWAFVPSELPFHTKPGVRFPPGLHQHS